jgi:uncharacterized cupredoxin-like copper-binding protein
MRARASTPRRLVRVSFVLLSLLLIACGGSSRSANGTTTVRIILSHLRFAPAALTVKAGTTVHFALVNSDPIEHEFVLGSEEVQEQHERMRMSGSGMMHGSGMAAIPAGKTEELTHTFERAGTVIFGCHVDNHYAQGMKGNVTVT